MEISMAVGDIVRHRISGAIGKIVGFSQRNGGVIIDLSNDKGIRFRRWKINSLEVIKCQNQNVHIEKAT